MTEATHVPQITLGAGPLAVSRLGLGCMGMSDFYGPADDATSIKTLHAALDGGITFFDTADMYGRGRNEELLARAFADRWDRLVLATKFGIVRHDDGSRSINGRPEYVHQACDASLRRLGIDRIDLYYAHRPDPETPIEETVGAMRQLVEAGKVRAIGLSEVTPDQIRRAHAVHPITALQTEYSMWSREPEEALFAVCRELSITFVAYSPLGRGYLTGAIPNVESLAEGDWRRTNPRFSDAAAEANRRFVDTIGEIATRHGRSPAQIALGWVMQKNAGLVPIPGTRRIDRLTENIGALEVELTPEDLRLIDERLPVGSAAGARY